MSYLVYIIYFELCWEFTGILSDLIQNAELISSNTPIDFILLY